MQKLLIAAGAAALAFAAVPATAQVAGGLTGQVGADVGGQVAAPPVGSATGSTLDTARGAVNDARDVTGQTVRDAQDTLGHMPDADVDAAAGADAHGGVDASGAAMDLDVQSGAAVHTSDGGMIGHVVDVTRDSAGRAQSMTVRTADGAMRSVPATGASVQGGAVVTTMTEAELETQPE